MDHKKLLRTTFELALQSREHGNLLFASILTDLDGNILAKAENTVLTENNPLGHAELNLLLNLPKLYDVEYLHQCTIYAIHEPCPMCTAAIYWSGIGRLVYALSNERFYSTVGELPKSSILSLPCRELLKTGKRTMEIIGPLLEEEAAEIYSKYWT